MKIVLLRTIFRGFEADLEYIFVQPPQKITPLKIISALPPWINLNTPLLPPPPTKMSQLLPEIVSIIQEKSQLP